MSLFKINSDETLYVVYPAAITSHEFEQAETIMNRVRALGGVRPVLLCDRNKSPENILPDNAPAILVGNTIATESRRVLSGLTYGEAELRLIGRRVVVAAHTDDLLPALISSLADSMKLDGDTLIIDVDERRIKGTRFLHRLPLCDGGRLIAYRKSCDECDMVVLADTDENMYRAYLNKLGGMFHMEWERELHGNLFAAFSDDTVAIHVYYTPHNHFIRALIEPVANLYVQHDESFSTVTTPQLTFMGRRFGDNFRYLGKDSGAGQMSYCIRLSDGSFLVYDGGLETDAFADAIYDVMRDQAPDPENLVIAAWIITHSHADHIGGFVKFAQKYSDKVKLEQLMFNFPSMQDAEAFREAWNIRLTKETLYTRFPDAVFSKLHSGDVVKVRDAEIEVLYTHEDFVIQYISMLNTHIYNNCSLVSRMTLGGTKFMFMADSQEDANAIIVAMYGDYLKSDMLQVCHHGGCGGTVPLYEAIDPEVAIFSTTDALLPEYLSVIYNYHLVYEQHVRQIFNSAENTITLPLPYTPGECNIPPFEGTIVEKLSSTKGCVIKTANKES